MKLTDILSISTMTWKRRWQWCRIQSLWLQHSTPLLQSTRGVERPLG